MQLDARLVFAFLAARHAHALQSATATRIKTHMPEAMGTLTDISRRSNTTQMSPIDRILLLPGFALHPSDYHYFMNALELPCSAVDIWPSSKEDLKAIGPPGSSTFESWLRDTVELCKEFGLEGTMVFAHSAGSVVARRLNVPVVTYGSTNHGQQLCIVGGDDSLVNTDDTVQGKTVVYIENANHFSCVDSEAAVRSMALHEQVTGHASSCGAHVDMSLEIASVVNAFLRDAHE